MAYHRIRDMLRTPTPAGTEAAKLDEANLELVYERVKQGASSAPQAASRPQVVYILSGTMTMTVGGETKEVKAGDCWMIAAGTPHGFASPSSECIRLVIGG